jgi:UDP-galactopyranose mutase
LYFDYVVVGAGISGLTIAERIASQLGTRVLIVEKRRHIGGNCADAYDADGLLVHTYGPHIFHTVHKDVFDYLSAFTDWRLYQHRVLSYVDGQLLPFPICARTVSMLYGVPMAAPEVAEFLKSVAEPQRAIRTSEDVVIAAAGPYIYEKFFKQYTKKQWDVYPDELDPSVIARVPVRANGDERYFTDPYQGMPAAGYSAMFARMAAHPNISLLLGVDFAEVRGDIRCGTLIYTGPVDEYYRHEYGALKYRSIRMEFETYGVQEFQQAAVINYPNDYDFTRITEYKKLTGQIHEKTVISKEYPTWDGEPYYPVPQPAQQTLYAKYAERARTEKNVLFAGRLAEYRYYNMDAAVKAALALFETRIREGVQPE